MMSLTFGLFTQVSGSGPLGPLVFQNHKADMADILYEAYGTPPYIKYLKSFRSDHKQILSGLGKFGENDLKIPKPGTL